MRRAFLSAILLACAVSAPPIHAAENVDIATAEKWQKTLELVEATTPISEAKKIFVSNFMTSYAENIDHDDVVAKADLRKPGLRKAIKSAVASKLEIQASLELETMRNNLAKILEPTLNIEDIETALVFFRSPAGVRLKNRITAAHYAQNHETSDHRPRLDDARNLAAGTASASALQSMTVEDSIAVANFSQTPAARKMEEARPKFMAALGNELTAFSNRTLEKITRVIAAAVAKHMSSK